MRKEYDMKYIHFGSNKFDIEKFKLIKNEPYRKLQEDYKDTNRSLIENIVAYFNTMQTEFLNNVNATDNITKVALIALSNRLNIVAQNLIYFNDNSNNDCSIDNATILSKIEEVNSEVVNLL
jgi:hypothetical protein